MRPKLYLCKTSRKFWWLHCCVVARPKLYFAFISACQWSYFELIYKIVGFCTLSWSEFQSFSGLAILSRKPFCIKQTVLSWFCICVLCRFSESYQYIYIKSYSVHIFSTGMQQKGYGDQRVLIFWKGKLGQNGWNGVTWLWKTSENDLEEILCNTPSIFNSNMNILSPYIILIIYI